MAGYKIVEDTSKDFIANHAGADNFNSGIMTWSEGQGATNGIKATVANDPVVRYIDDRVFSRLLSNDLNLLFNLDRTVYVSKKGVEDGMARDENDPSSVARIQHFDSISKAVQFFIDLNDDTAPRYESTSFWSNSERDGDETTTPTAVTIIVGPGTYESESDLFTKLGVLSQYNRVHILGYGNACIGNQISWTASTGGSAKPNPQILLENLDFADINAGSRLNLSVNFKNVFIKRFFNLELLMNTYNYYAGELRFLDACIKFSGLNSMIVQTDTGLGFWTGTKGENIRTEKSYFGETTMDDSGNFKP